MKDKICYFCGIQGADTREEIPPRCFFPKGHTESIIKIPAHMKCNQAWQGSIEYARNLFCGINTSNCLARDLFSTKVIRSLRRNPPLRLQMLKDLRENIELYSPGGIYLRSTPGICINTNLLDQFISHVIRGLYFHHTGQPLPKGINVTWQVQQDHPGPERLWFTRLPITIVHPAIFRYRHIILGDNPGWSAWVLGFYELNTCTVLAVTGKDRQNA